MDLLIAKEQHPLDIVPGGNRRETDEARGQCADTSRKVGRLSS
jgi:hypothetical protein